MRRDRGIPGAHGGAARTQTVKLPGLDASAVVAIDDDGRVRMVDGSLEAMLGVPAESLVGRPIESLVDAAVREVAGRKAIEEELRRSERRLAEAQQLARLGSGSGTSRRAW